MKFKLDENLPVELLSTLREAGHEADSVHDEGLVGKPDPEILRQARAEERILLTMDKGIGDIRAYRPDQYAGIVLFRPPSSGRRAVFDFVGQNLQKVLDLDLRGRLVVVSGTGVRTR